MLKNISIIILALVSIISLTACFNEYKESPEELRQRLLNDSPEKYFLNYDLKTHEGEKQFLSYDLKKYKSYFKVIYGPKRNVVRVEKYFNGQPNGYWTYYNREGKIVKLDYYSLGKLTQSVKNPY